MTAAERYLVLGLRLGRHVDGLVDSYYGPAELQQQVDAEGKIDAAQLAADGDALLAELPDGWLYDQVQGCATYAHVLAGDDISYVDEVEGCYGVRPELVDTSVYEAAHARARRAAAGRRLALRAPPGAGATQHLVDGALAVAGAERPAAAPARGGTAAFVELPEGEALTIEPVTDEPWWAFNYYLGDLRSRVVLNVDVPTTGLDLIHLAAHEVYPGHHTEHAVKEQLLVARPGRDRGVASSSCRRRRPCSAKASPRRARTRARRRRRAPRRTTSCARHGIDCRPRSSASASRRRSSRCAPSGSTPR